MKNKRNFWLSFALCLAALLTVAGTPYTAGQAAGQDNQVQITKPKDIKLAPDVVVYVRAYSPSYEKGVKAIPEGASVEEYGNADFKFVFSLVNKGLGAAENFTYKLVIRDHYDNVKVYDPPAAKLTLKPGETRIFTAHLPNMGTSHFEARVLADIGDFLKEANESNNLAALKFKFHEQPK